MDHRALVSAALACLVLAAGCGGDDEEVVTREAETSPRARDDAKSPPDLPPPRCPAGVAGCATASGRVLYVERVDPDGDGDAHFVLAGDDSITGPGISVIDVKRSLRPSPLPRPGDRLSAAGPVRIGSYGQRQIEAVAVRAR